MWMSPKGIGVTEARAMADILTKELGVQEERLLLEEEARSTVENAVNVLGYFLVLNKVPMHGYAIYARLRCIVTCIGPNQKNQPNLDLYLVWR